MEEEINILKEIYFKELKEITCQEDGSTLVTVDIRPATADELSKQFICVIMHATCPAGYPDTVPTVDLKCPRGLEQERLDELLERVRAEAEQLRGDFMLMHLIELVKDSLTQQHLPDSQCPICLETFESDADLLVTGCFHYFHCACLAEFVHFRESEHGRLVREALINDPHCQRLPQLSVACPVCRQCWVSFDGAGNFSSEWLPPPSPDLAASGPLAAAQKQGSATRGPVQPDAASGPCDVPAGPQPVERYYRQPSRQCSYQRGGYTDRQRDSAGRVDGAQIGDEAAAGKPLPNSPAARDQDSTCAEPPDGERSAPQRQRGGQGYQRLPRHQTADQRQYQAGCDSLLQDGVRREAVVDDRLHDSARQWQNGRSDRYQQNGGAPPYRQQAGPNPQYPRRQNVHRHQYQLQEGYTDQQDEVFSHQQHYQYHHQQGGLRAGNRYPDPQFRGYEYHQQRNHQLRFQEDNPRHQQDSQQQYNQHSQRGRQHQPQQLDKPQQPHQQGHQRQPHQQDKPQQSKQHDKPQQPQQQGNQQQPHQQDNQQQPHQQDNQQQPQQQDKPQPSRQQGNQQQAQQQDKPQQSKQQGNQQQPQQQDKPQQSIQQDKPQQSIQQDKPQQSIEQDNQRNQQGIRRSQQGNQHSQRDKQPQENQQPSQQQDNQQQPQQHDNQHQPKQQGSQHNQPSNQHSLQDKQQPPPQQDSQRYQYHQQSHPRGHKQKHRPSSAAAAASHQADPPDRRQLDLPQWRQQPQPPPGLQPRPEARVDPFGGTYSEGGRFYEPNPAWTQPARRGHHQQGRRQDDPRTQQAASGEPPGLGKATSGQNEL